MSTAKLARLATTLAVGLTLAAAMTLVIAAGAVLGAPLMEDQPDGSIIISPQTIDGTWGPGVITASSNVVINAGVIITIAPNTTILVADGVGFTVNGDLHSDGPVIFTSASSPAAPGAWTGITYAPGSNGYLNQAIVEYAQHAVVLDTPNPVTISNSELRYNRHAPAANSLAYGAGLYIVQGNHLIQSTRIYSNTAASSGTGQVRGGGVYIITGTPQILDSWIYENTATSIGNVYGAGGGIAMAGGGALIEDSYILTNTLSGGSSTSGVKSGGGIGIVGNTNAVIRGSLIATNRITLTAGNAGGGGIGLGENSRASLIERNVIQGNYMYGPYWCEGGGIDTWDTSNSVIIRNNLIFSNTFGVCGNGSPYGGGINLNGGGAGTIVVNNTIVDNRAALGGGLYLQGGTVTATNNIVAYNSATNQGGGIFRAVGTANYNDMYGNTAPTGPNYQGTVGANNIYLDPLFVGAGDLPQWYHIRQGSPAIDAGDSTSAPTGDYDGQPRPLGAAWDIGFDEVQPFTYAKSVDLATARGNDALAYTIVVTNPDPISTFVGGQITDVLPLNTSYSSGPTCDVGVCGYDGGNNAITWTGDIAPNTTLNLGYAVRVDPGLADGTDITNTAFITVGMAGKTTDAVTTTIYNPGFELTKHTEGTLVVGTPVTYAIVVTNTSAQADGTDVVVNDTLPSGAGYVSGGTLQDSVVSWTIPMISAGGQAQVSFVVSTCQTSLVNNTYQVVTSAQHVASTLGPALNSNLVAPTLVAGFAHDPSVNIVMGQTVNFTDTSVTDGSPIVAWAWDFGDANTATGPTASHTYAAPGSYTVTLSIADACGYADTVEVPIEVYSAITVNKVGNGTVTLDPSPGPYSLNQVVTLTAAADLGWTFAGWGGACSGTGACTLTMDGNKTIDATFTRNEYTLDITVVGNGSVTRDPDQTKYYYGDVVTLTATHDLYWSFDGWSGDMVSAANPLVITIEDDTNITATFKQFNLYLPVIMRGN